MAVPEHLARRRVPKVYASEARKRGMPHVWEQQRLLDFMHATGTRTIAKLAEKTGMPYWSVVSHLRKLQAGGVVDNPRRGIWLPVGKIAPATRKYMYPGADD